MRILLDDPDFLRAAKEARLSPGAMDFLRNIPLKPLPLTEEEAAHAKVLAEEST